MSLTKEPEPVKRPYASPRRLAQQRATRRAILDAAAALFIEHGYVATSFDTIAEAASVGRATVFAHFPRKSDLLKAAYDVILVGDDEPVPLPERPESLAVRADPDPRGFLSGYATIATGVAQRVSPIYEAIRGAAHADPEAAAIWRQVRSERRIGGGNVIAGVVARRALRTDVDPERAADFVYAMVDPGLYDLLVHECGWTHETFTAWLAATLQRELLAQ
jgi:TetR/AcrR family transcriptional regulator, regulator of autoinduction and epiphytic fitness